LAGALTGRPGLGHRLLTAIEAMLGIGLFALFVFTLGNRMRRS